METETEQTEVTQKPLDPASPPARLRRLREASGVSQYGFAEALDVHQTLVSAWERGKLAPAHLEALRIDRWSAEQGERIAHYEWLGMSASDAGEAAA